jgi:hygromycin-B 7''-O-kinase
MRAHQLERSPWTRAALGRNIVFVSPTAAIKLGPPMWAGQMAREAAALGAVAGRLPIATPTVLALGALGQWEYLVQAPLPGTNLHAIWAALGASDRAVLAEQHGALMAALHGLPLQDFPAALAFDWPALLGARVAQCVTKSLGITAGNRHGQMWHALIGANAN